MRFLIPETGLQHHVLIQLRPAPAPDRADQLLESSFLPGMMYVNDLSADSICDTELAFFSTKSSYMLNHFDGMGMAFGIRLCACL